MTSAGLTLSSDDFTDGGTLPNAVVYSGMGYSGDNRSPALSWTGAPAGTQSFALAMHDPDAPTTVGFTHWILFDLDAGLAGLAAGAGTDERKPAGSTHGLNDFPATAYCGPAPPPGSPHHYHFTLYALDVPKLEGAGSLLTYPRFRFMIRGHVLAEATLTGRFGK
jgi:Raf kinase inhibitor-like YbhB/YbcL family protein